MNGEEIYKDGGARGQATVKRGEREIREGEEKLRTKERGGHKNRQRCSVLGKVWKRVNDKTWISKWDISSNSACRINSLSRSDTRYNKNPTVINSRELPCTKLDYVPYLCTCMQRLLSLPARSLRTHLACQICYLDVFHSSDNQYTTSLQPMKREGW